MRASSLIWPDSPSRSRPVARFGRASVPPPVKSTSPGRALGAIALTIKRWSRAVSAERMALARSLSRNASTSPPIHPQRAPRAEHEQGVDERRPLPVLTGVEAVRHRRWRRRAYPPWSPDGGPARRRSGTAAGSGGGRRGGLPSDPAQRSGDVRTGRRPLGQVGRKPEAASTVRAQPHAVSKYSASQRAWRTTCRKVSGSSSESRTGMAEQGANGERPLRGAVLVDRASVRHRSPPRMSLVGVGRG